jgi:radical SAM superfamily enzyme with C-terminal helix-hairpin-helix motif
VLQGAEVVKKHPNFPSTLIAEVETFRGCTRYHSGGCSFCIEPEFGEPLFRDQANIIAEVKTLKKAGIAHYRLGAQSCIYSYRSKDVGTHSAPQPIPEEIERLLTGVRQVIGRKGLLHVDNANPAVLSDYPVQSRKITKYIIENCTGGNVVAFGMESADPDVIRSNNLNSRPEQVMNAIELVNELGRKRGYTGLPALLPGLNFISGLKGESKSTFKMNLEFLKEVKTRGFLLRRINIRQVAGTRREFKHSKFQKDFKNFKRQVREDIDRPMLKGIAPVGTILKDVFIEAHEGNVSFGRQLGTYPLLVGIPYKIPSGTRVYAYIFDHGYRSITGCEYPFPINKAPMSHIKTLPGLGARRAARLVTARPFKKPADLISALDDKKVAEGLLRLVKLGKPGK